uniref:Galectin n=1 Tax=Ursus americanus TaxID=9643 RepID=A0A452SGB7_URSAM
MVMLQGVVPLKAHRFQVDFQCGCSLHPRPDIAIHFNPRFHTSKPHVICNTLRLERWQAEARWPRLPLQRGAPFLILFLFGNEEMKVSVNGQHFLHYRYRLPLSRVDTLGIFGDILVEAVGFLNISPFAEGGSEYPVGYVSLQGARLSLVVPATLAEPPGLPSPPAGPAGHGAAAQVGESQLPFPHWAVAMDPVPHPQPPVAGKPGFSSGSPTWGQLGKMDGVGLLPRMGRAPGLLSEDPAKLQLSVLSNRQRQPGSARRTGGQMRPKATQ